MRRSLYISGAAHAGLLAWLFFGWGLSSDPFDVDVTEVSIISGADFDAAVRAGQPMVEVENSPTPTVPDLPSLAISEPVPDAAPLAPPPVPAPRPAELVAPPSAPAPDPTAREPVQPVAPIASVPSPPEVPVAPVESAAPNLERGESATPSPREATRLAPIAAAAPDPAAQVSEQTQAATAEGEDAATPAQDATAPEEAASEVVTEAEQESFAPEISLRPQARRPRPVSAPDATPDATPDPEPSPAPVDPLAAALAQAAAAPTPAPSPEPAPSPQQGSAQGQSLTADEIGSFLGQISACWYIEAASTDALKTVVSLTFELTQEGMVVPGSIERAGYTGGTAQAADIAYRVAEQAVTECQTKGRSGYDLPAEKFPAWRELRIRFNPETMRLR